MKATQKGILRSQMRELNFRISQKNDSAARALQTRLQANSQAGETFA
jgi:hypothetical protein